MESQSRKRWSRRLVDSSNTSREPYLFSGRYQIHNSWQLTVRRISFESNHSFSVVPSIIKNRLTLVTAVVKLTMTSTTAVSDEQHDAGRESTFLNPRDDNEQDDRDEDVDETDGENDDADPLKNLPPARAAMEKQLEDMRRRWQPLMTSWRPSHPSPEAKHRRNVRHRQWPPQTAHLPSPQRKSRRSQRRPTRSTMHRRSQRV